MKFFSSRARGRFAFFGLIHTSVCPINCWFCACLLLLGAVQDREAGIYKGKPKSREENTLLNSWLIFFDQKTFFFHDRFLGERVFFLFSTFLVFFYKFPPLNYNLQFKEDDQERSNVSGWQVMPQGQVLYPRERLGCRQRGKGWGTYRKIMIN